MLQPGWFGTNFFWGAYLFSVLLRKTSLIYKVNFCPVFGTRMIVIIILLLLLYSFKFFHRTVCLAFIGGQVNQL